MSGEFITLKTELEHRANKSVIIAGVKCRFDEFGFVDVPERHAKDLIAAGLIPVSAKEKEKYAEIKEQAEKMRKENSPAIDIFDESQKLKLVNEKLVNENEELKKRISELELQLIEAMGSIEPETQEEVEEIKESGVEELLDGMKFKEMQEFCSENGLPEEEWKSIKKTEDLRAYLVDKLNKAD